MIRITCEGAGRIAYNELIPFQGELKTLSKKNYAKLKKEILDLGFSEPISIWQNEGKNFILNGHQRQRAIKQMVEEEGMACDPLPVNFIQASTIGEAKRKVLALTSQYGEITKQGLYEFMHEADIPMPEIEASFSFPGINFEEFNVEFFAGEIAQNCEKEFEELAPFDGPDDRWRLIITCPNEQERLDFIQAFKLEELDIQKLSSKACSIIWPNQNTQSTSSQRDDGNLDIPQDS